MSRYGGGGYGGGAPPRAPVSAGPPLFDPAKGEVALLDELAEKQADSLEEMNSSQLRRFFGEVKEHSRRLEALAAGRSDDEAQAIYAREIEPLFKMMRSKVAYASRMRGNSSVPASFQAFLDQGIRKVTNVGQFRLFVRHFEAVVGFLYGKGKVKS